jgi:trans-aconitate 2-methyltransferase
VVEWDPAAYGLVNRLQQEVARQALSDLSLRGNERVLDVGCGDGRVTAMIADRLTCGSLVGVDPSEAMVQAAQQRFSGDPRVAIALGTASELTYEAEFDFVCSFNALHWETRWQAALQRIRAALRPGGRALLVFVCDGERPSVEDVNMDIAFSPRWRSWFEDFTAPYVHVDPTDYVDVAVESGFEVHGVRTPDLEWDFGSREAFEDWCSAGMVAWTSQVPVEQRPAFVHDVVDEYAKVSGSDSVFRFLQCRVALVAT